MQSQQPDMDTIKAGRVKYDDGLQKLSRKMWQDVGGLSRDAALLRQRAISLRQQGYELAGQSCNNASTDLLTVIESKKFIYSNIRTQLLSKRGKKYL